MSVQTSPLVPSSPSRIVLEAGRSEHQYWADLWRYRELLFFLAWRDVSVRYKQTVFGITWAVIRPLLTMVVLVIVFSKVARLPSDGIPYTLLVLAGMLCWQLFAAGLSSTSESLLGSSNLISKVYFPRLVIPLSSLAVSLIDFIVTLPIVAVLMVVYGEVPSWRIVGLPLVVMVALAAALGVGLWLSALSIRYRDVRYILPFVVQFGIYVSPVGYSLSAVPENYQGVFALNPITGLIETFRWTIFTGATPPSLLAVSISILFTLACLWSGVRYFRATERTFADVI